MHEITAANQPISRDASALEEAKWSGATHEIGAADQSACNGMFLLEGGRFSEPER
jgi:hypothetical protein